VKKRRTLTDLNEMAGWSKVDNDTSRHDATSVIVTHIGHGARPWRVIRLGRYLGSAYSSASSAIDRALDEVFELERSAPRTAAGRPWIACDDGSVVIDTDDVTDIVLERDDLLAMLDINLAKVWNEGRAAGDQENDDFHTDREPIREAINPYAKTSP
jgi:hypothetical protein